MSPSHPCHSKIAQICKSANVTIIVFLQKNGISDSANLYDASKFFHIQQVQKTIKTLEKAQNHKRSKFACFNGLVSRDKNFVCRLIILNLYFFTFADGFHNLSFPRWSNNQTQCFNFLLFVFLNFFSFQWLEQPENSQNDRTFGTTGKPELSETTERPDWSLRQYIDGSRQNTFLIYKFLILYLLLRPLKVHKNENFLAPLLNFLLFYC